MTGPAHTNRLINCTSPYLLQHAHNPVDWFPWSREALDRAKREDRPILLSIGYSACHWCHVMERESFEDEDVARIMNENFVCIKVDREERPDLDEIYMNAVQAMSGSGGWPLNVFLRPDLKPFFGGTYFPPDDMYGRPSFKKILLAAADAYRNKREGVNNDAERLFDVLESIARPLASAEGLDESPIAAAAAHLKSDLDPEFGGFGGAPKFPSSSSVNLLLRHYKRSGDKEALSAATLTLDGMAYGGIFDQLGGGFHRYSIDREWLIPHFEKMLYDNAQLASAYIDAFQLTKNPFYAEVASRTLDCVLREMTDKDGGFYSAQDADTEGEEGRYYAWSEEEIRQTLSADEADLFCGYYDVTEEGNFEGRNVLYAPAPLDLFARKISAKPDEIRRRLDDARKKLLAKRTQRTPPGRDEKILADWNGLMITAFARGFQVLFDERYKAAAKRAADFVFARMRPGGRLMHVWSAGTAHTNAFLDDYAFMLQAMVDLYETTFDAAAVKSARVLAKEMIEMFWDKEGGGFFSTQAGQADAILRSKKAHDGSIPPGNAVAAHALLRLAKLTDDKDLFQKAEETLSVFSASMKQSPGAFTRLLCALDFYFSPTVEVAIAGRRGENSTKKLLDVVHRHYLPNRILALASPESSDATASGEDVPLLESKTPVGGKAAAYVCENYACDKPVTDAGELDGILAKK